MTLHLEGAAEYGDKAHAMTLHLSGVDGGERCVRFWIQEVGIFGVSLLAEGVAVKVTIPFGKIDDMSVEKDVMGAMRGLLASEETKCTIGQKEVGWTPIR
jgi:hypothetical protein